MSGTPGATDGVRSKHGKPGCVRKLRVLKPSSQCVEMCISRAPEGFCKARNEHGKPGVCACAQGLCSEQRLEREKSVLKQGAVQHLYARLAGTLLPGTTDAHLLVRTLP